jgi:hypothetical protein
MKAIRRWLLRLIEKEEVGIRPKTFYFGSDVEVTNFMHMCDHCGLWFSSSSLERHREQVQRRQTTGGAA